MPETWSQNVSSKQASVIGYDADAEELLVTWKSGRQSAYQGVPEALAQQLANAPSVGQMLNSEIKNQYPHRYVR